MFSVARLTPRCPGSDLISGVMSFKTKVLSRNTARVGARLTFTSCSVWMWLQHSLIAAMPSQDAELCEEATHVQTGIADIARAPEWHDPSICVWDAQARRWRIWYGGEWQQLNFPLVSINSSACSGAMKTCGGGTAVVLYCATWLRRELWGKSVVQQPRLCCLPNSRRSSCL